MEVIYDKIFFNKDKNILFQLQDFTKYYYTGTNEQAIEQVKPIKRRDEYISPKQKDTLFWCFFGAPSDRASNVNFERSNGERSLSKSDL